MPSIRFLSFGRYAFMHCRRLILQSSGFCREQRIDMPQLQELEIGKSAFSFMGGGKTKLVMKCWWRKGVSDVALPKLHSIYNTGMFENKHSLTFSSLRWVECAGRSVWLDAWSDMPELTVVNAPIISVSKRNVISNSSSVGSFGEHVDTGKMLIHIQVYCNLCSNNYESSYNRDSSVLSTITLQTSILSNQQTSITPLFPLHYLYCVNHETT